MILTWLTSSASLFIAPHFPSPLHFPYDAYLLVWPIFLLLLSFHTSFSSFLTTLYPLLPGLANSYY